MQRVTYQLQSRSADGTAHDVGEITLEGNQKVGAAMRTPDAEEARRERIQRLSALCRIRMPAASGCGSLKSFKNEGDS